MDALIPLLTKAGKRQKVLLFELEKQAIICLNRENGLWMREALMTKLAKDLLYPHDRTIEEKIQDLEPDVLRLERDAEVMGVKLSGGTRFLLDKLYSTKQKIYLNQ